MTAEQTKVIKQPMCMAQAGAASSASPSVDLGPMPEWDLTDLYPSPDSPEVERDFAAAAAQAKRFKQTYHGQLVAMGRDGAKLAQAVKEDEQLADLMGRLRSYAGLLYAAAQSVPARAKSYGDTSERLTNISNDLIFFVLALNKIEEADLVE